MNTMPDMPRPCATAPLDAEDYRSAIRPIWCPGCGDYSVLAALTEALARLGLPPERVALISGIGCSSRLPAYTNVYGFHGVHGRALPIATGLKLARPDLTVLAAGGDGDGFSIGGNHFLHACRRNVDLTYIVMDNQVYGMTKGQASPTTADDWTGSDLTPDGPRMPPFRPLVMALAAGANYIARCFSGDQAELVETLCEAIRHPGFSLVQILSPCATFRPEQRQWKNQVRPLPGDFHPDRDGTVRLLLQDDGFHTGGAIFKGDRPPFQPLCHPQDSPDALETEFLL